jgi:hypothetical protein
VPAVSSRRVALPDGASTTCHVAAFPLDRLRARVVALPERETLVHWCRRNAVPHAIVGGFFVRPHNAPLGQLRVDGRDVDHVPFMAPWGDVRACVHIDGTIAIARRPDLPADPIGDLLQAGPLLVRGGVSVVDGLDAEGFTAGAVQFDSDISDGRHPRCALALTDDALLAVACDGRHDDEAGMTLGELADALVAEGAHSAMNLDGGGSASLVCDGALVNIPREQHGIALEDGRPIATLLVLDEV